MRDPRRPSWRLAAVALGALLVAVAACGDGDDTSRPEEEETDGEDVAALLGPEDEATGEPVRIGMVSDGSTAAFDNTDELRSAEATVEYWNTHRGGVGGRPIELVTCETGADPAGATDCGNQMVEEEVVAVALSQSAVAESVWEPIHSSGIPTMWFQASGAGILTDQQTSFVIINPLTTLFGLPISVAETEEAERIAFVVVDVPQAIAGFQALGPSVMANAGLDYDVVAIPQGTADMTSQMREVADSGAGVVHVIGNDAFCIAAFNGLTAVGYHGAITSISQCITDATREAVPGEDLEGMYLAATVAVGATDDPTYQLYEAVMSTYGDDVTDVENNIAMSAYTALSALATSLDGISGDITPETAAATIKAMPQQELAGGGGMTFRCGRSAIAMTPAVCTNEWLRTQLDAEGQPTTYETVDSTDIVP